MRFFLRIFVPVLIFQCLAGGTPAEILDFTLLDLDGKKHRLADYRGKWVLVNYWATWCPPCLEEIPELEVFHSNHKDSDAVVLGVNMEDISLEKLQAFVEDQFISYPILRSKPASRTELGGITGLPTSYLVSPQGRVVARQVGPITAQLLDDYLEKHVQQTSKGRASQ